jgi:fibrillarin-like rRNA methylase
VTEKVRSIGKHTNKVISDLKLEILGKDHEIVCLKHKHERTNNLNLPSPRPAKLLSIKSATTNITPEPMPIFERYVKNFKNRSDVSKFVQLPNGV